ncbi:MAG: cytochrome ubiquinol oxidase subunit I [Chlamydiota bacterium]|jgi:cytochrome d ubiquinol oxidase subunit I
MDPLTLSRIQFALNVSFHYLFPPISIGLGLMLVIMEGMYLKTKDEKYKILTQFWIKIFALVFAIGVATGIVQTFAFGTNWARYSKFVGDVFGSALAAEGIFAFFLEAGFLGILLFGWDKVSQKVHYFATICVCLGAHFSAVWIVAANSWMQTPAGFTVEGEGENARAIISSFWEMIINHSTLDRLAHVILACWITGAFFVMSVAAYYLIKKIHIPLAETMMKLGLVIAGITLLLQLVSGDSSARLVAKHQPAKLAAFEGVFTTEPYTPISVVGWVDKAKEKVYSIKIPAGLSLLTYRNPETPVTGLDKFDKKDWPNVSVVFQTYHLMVAIWGIMFLLAVAGFYLWRKKRLDNARWYLWSMVFAVILPHIAQQSGWISAEMGRQPWIVYNILRTSEGVSKNIVTSQVLSSLIMFIFIYGLLFALFIFLLDRKIKHGPVSFEEKPDTAEVYSDIYKASEEH